MGNTTDADELLKIVNKDEIKKKEGLLKIFFGMSAGVGKTYSMLSEAHQKLKEGKDVLVGIVETHGRAETLQLVSGLPMLPQKEVVYRGTTFFELDLDKVLEKKPQLVVIDELAHTNIPGSRHPKRWQDVLEILSQGIDVYTALNVQHVESLKNEIEQITGIPIRETVPDSIIERANLIEVIDLAPDDLLKRLREGKVYIKDKADQALKNFFQEEKLMALREFSLRMAAKKVEVDLKEKRASTSTDKKVWRTQETLMVAVGDGIYSEKLIRMAKQQATRLSCPWVALFVDTGHNAGEQARRTIAHNLNLARDLGAEVISTVDLDIVAGIERVCLQKQVTQIILGSPRKRVWRDFLRGGSFLDRLNRLDNNMAILIVRQDYPKYRGFFNLFQKAYWKKKHFLLAFIALSFTTVVSFFLNHYLKILPYMSVGMLFLLTVGLLGLIIPLFPTLVSIVLAIVIWSLGFIPPLFTITIDHPDDIALCLTFFLVGTVNAVLNTAIRKREKLLRLQEERTQALYQVVHHFALAKDTDECINLITEEIGKILQGLCGVALKGVALGGALEHFKKGTDWPFNRAKEWAAAVWSFDHQQAAGLGTDTLPYAEAIYMPLKSKEQCLGVLAFRPGKLKNKLSVDEEELLQAVAAQLALYLEARNH